MRRPVHVERDREQYHRPSRIPNQSKGPGQVFVPALLVETMKEKDQSLGVGDWGLGIGGWGLGVGGWGLGVLGKNTGQ